MKWEARRFTIAMEAWTILGQKCRFSGRDDSGSIAFHQDTAVGMVIGGSSRKAFREVDLNVMIPMPEDLESCLEHGFALNLADL